MNNQLTTLLIASTLWLSSATAHPSNSEQTPHTPAELKLETLLKTQLAGSENLEVTMSRVTIPANSQLPKHWHPGEEFAYVLQGSVTLWQQGKEDIPFQAGDAAMVPLKQIHTAITQEEGVTLLVFRVHEKGQPERVTVD